MNPILSKEANNKVEKIRRNIGDRQIIRMVPPKEPEVQTEDEQAIIDLIAILDSLFKKPDPNEPEEMHGWRFDMPLSIIVTLLNNPEKYDRHDVALYLVERVRRAESRIEPKQEETNLGPDFEDWLTQESKRNRELREKLEGIDVKQYNEFEIRIKFETWVKDTWVHKGLNRFKDGSYMDPETDSSWHAYLQAFRDTGRFK